MKMNKFFMLGLAGLAFAACSNDEDALENSTFEGNGVVTVKIEAPALTKAAGVATTGANGSPVSVEGTITVTLTGLDGEGSLYNQSISISADELDNQTELKFWNIATPQKLTASINDGKASYVSEDLSGLQVAAANIPAYGETTTFNKRGGSGDSPSFDEDGNLVDTEAGADADDEGKVYQMYDATVTMAIPVARLEVGGIYHEVHAEGDDCIYTKLTLNGAYMDGYCTGGSTYTNGAFPNSTATAGDYSFDGIHGTGAQSALRDVIDPAIDFLTTTSASPAGTYTYNFYANGVNPIFKLYFAEAEGTDVIEPRYAMITRYYTQNEEGEKVETVFENGKIYRILKAELTDENIIGDEGGNTLYGVEVTVVEATWTIVDIQADWAE